MSNLTKRVASLRPMLGLVSVAAFLLAWHLAARFGGLPAFILPSPADVWTRFLRSLVDGLLLTHSFITLIEVLVGLLAGAFFATLIGYLIAKSRLLENLLSPYLVASQAVPLVAIAPLLIIWFGPGMFSKFLICALIVFFPVLVNTVVGVRAVPSALHDSDALPARHAWTDLAETGNPCRAAGLPWRVADRRDAVGDWRGGRRIGRLG